MKMTTFLPSFLLLIYGLSAESQNTYLYVTNRTSVFRLDVNAKDQDVQRSSTTLYDNGTYFYGLALNEDKQELFWSDLEHKTIYRGSLTEKNKTVFLSQTVGYVRSISIDWSSDVIYWTDSFLRHIEVATLDGKYRKTLFSFNTDAIPYAIFADSKDGFLFWTDVGMKPRIERSTLSGEQRKVLVSTTFSMLTDLFLDYKNGVLYWVDEYQELIESINIDGTNRRTVHSLYSDFTYFFPLTISYDSPNDKLYFGDWYNDKVYRIHDLHASSPRLELIYHNNRFDEYISKVRLSGIAKPTGVSRPCSSNLCSHICLKKNSESYTCHCPTGMYLADSTHCKDQQKEYEIYFSDTHTATVNHAIKYINQNGFVVKPLPVPKNVTLEFPVALDYHKKSGDIYWIDHGTHNLYRMKQNGSDFTLFATNVFSIAMEIDQLNDIIYYVDRKLNAITKISIKNANNRMTIKRYDFVDVYDIALYEELGYIYFADFGSRVIGRVNVDGSGMIRRTESLQLFYATGIAVDKIENRIYWTDNFQFTIKSANLTFGDVKLIAKAELTESFFHDHFSEGPAQPFSVSILNSKVIWTDVYHEGIYAVNKRFGGEVEFIAGGVVEPRNLHTFNDIEIDEEEKFYIVSNVYGCFNSNTTCQNAQDIDDDVQSCPPGYQTNLRQICYNCSQQMGGRQVCPCHDWATCAQRTFSRISCSLSNPYLQFKVRECKKVIRKGFCPYNATCVNNVETCQTDNQCGSNMKCCRSQCGFQCVQSLSKSDHPCQINNGGCSHFCIGKAKSYSCKCPDGMQLKNDSRTCREERQPDTILYLANTSSLFVLSFDTPAFMKPDSVLVHNKTRLHAVEVDEKNNYVYWSDLENHEINRMTVYGSNQTSLFTYGIGYAEGIGIDFSSNNIYWTDSILKVIEVSTVTGSNRKVLFDLHDESEPRAILVDAKHGYLYWTDWGTEAKIERSSLAGINRVTLVSETTYLLKWPNDLAMDCGSSKIYWVDAFYDYIGSMNFNGSNIQILKQLNYHHIAVHPFSLAYEENENIGYITDWHTNSLYRLSPFNVNGQLDIVYKNANYSVGKLIRQVRLYNKNNPTVNSPCLTDKSCSHLCLKLNETSYECECPTGMQKNGDTQCEDKPKEYEIYFADSKASLVNHLVKYKDQPGFTITPLKNPNEDFDSPMALDYHSKEENIYWVDTEKRNMYRMKPNGTDFKLILSNISSPAIEIDQLSNVIYYFDSIRKAIMLSSMDGKYKKTIKAVGLSSVYDIAIHEELGFIFYSDLGYNIIARIDTNGRNEHTHGRFISNGVPVQATGLAVDKIENRIYWCERANEAIRSSDFEFNNIRTIVQKTYFFFGSFYFFKNDGKVVEPFSISILGDDIYWTEIYHGDIYKTSKRYGGKIEFVTAGLDHPRDLHIFNNVKKDELEKVYYFSISRQACHESNSTCSSDEISEPKNCTNGYNETKYAYHCEKCNIPLGTKFACPCNDWASCAQRTYMPYYCYPEYPYFSFKVRECTKVVRFGICPYHTQYYCPGGDECNSDNDCPSNYKCCKTSCGQKCVGSLMKSDHPCKVDNGNCSHFCFGKQYSYTCECPDGMQLDTDGKICQDKPFKSELVYFLNLSTVFELNVTSLYKKENAKIIYQGDHSRDYLHSLEIDQSNKDVYWNDYLSHSINKYSQEDNTVKNVIAYAVANVEGISIDWSSHLLYWTDSWMRHIEVSTTEGNNRKVLLTFSENRYPYSILADNINGYLFWSDVGDNPSIERSDLAGKHRKTIVAFSEYTYAYDIAIDHTTNRIYWLNFTSEHISSSNFDGSDIVIMRNLTYHELFIFPYSFALNEESNTGYITDWETNSLYRISPLSADGKVSVLHSEHAESFYSIGQVRAYQTKKFQVSNPCASGSHQCSHLCFKINITEHVCDCPTGMKLNDLYNCVPQPKRLEMIFVDNLAGDINHVTQYQQQPGFVVKPIKESNPNESLPTALDYHLQTKLIYWSDIAEEKIYQMDTDGNNIQVIKNNVQVFALEINQLNNILYYHDRKSRSMKAFSINKNFEKTIFDTGSTVIEDIAIHEMKGYIFYFSYYALTSTYALGRMDLDGKNSLYSPITEIHIKGIAVDQNENRLYWSDRLNEAIQSSDLNFNDVQTIVQSTYEFFGDIYIDYFNSKVVEPSSLSVLGEYIYWTDKYHEAIYETKKRFGGNIDFITAGLRTPEDLHVFADTSMKEYKKQYYFGFQEATCFESKSQCNEFISIPDDSVQECPSGYRQNRIVEKCMACNETLGFKHVCPCKDWASCAQRTYTTFSGCSNDEPFLKFKVRECIQEVRPGFCPYLKEGDCRNSSIDTQCTSDGDCQNTMKCCRHACGFKCMKSLNKTDHPCSIQTSKCSHFCMGTETSYKCACPDSMKLASNNFTCLESSCDILNGRCSHTCEKTPSGSLEPYKCTCPSGMMIKNDLLTCVNHSCADNNGGCSDICESIDYSHHRCKCPKEKILDSDNKTCYDDRCIQENGGCSQICIPRPTDAQCRCYDNYILSSDSKTCVVDNCTRENGGCSDMCNPGIYNYTCSCPNRKIISDSDWRLCVVDNCTRENGGCSDMCNPGIYNYTCSCPNGKIVSDSDWRLCVVNDCKRDNGGCSNTCTATPYNYTCSCPSGKRLSDANQKLCIDITCGTNECSDICTPDGSSYKCSCPSTKILNTNGKTCSDRACLSQDCSGNGVCTDTTGGGFDCQCSEEYYTGPICNDDLREQTTTITLQLNPSFTRPTLQDIKEFIARKINELCSSVPGRCSSFSKRRRRSTTSSNVTVSPDDVYIKDFNIDSNNVLTFSFAVKQPKTSTSTSSNSKGAIDTSVISATLDTYKEDLKTQFNASSIAITYPETKTAPKDDGGLSSGAIGAIVFVVILVVLIIPLIAYFCLKFRRGIIMKSVSRMRDNITGNNNIPAKKFENEEDNSVSVNNLYDMGAVGYNKSTEEVYAHPDDPAYNQQKGNSLASSQGLSNPTYDMMMEEQKHQEDSKYQQPAVLEINSQKEFENPVYNVENRSTDQYKSPNMEDVNFEDSYYESLKIPPTYASIRKNDGKFQVSESDA